MEELQAMEKADGAGVAKKGVDQMAKPSDTEKSEKIKLTGGGKEIGSDNGGVKGKPAEGAGDPAICKADGKSVQSTKVGDAKCCGSQSGKAVEKADGSSVESTSVGKAKFNGKTDGKAMEKADGKGVESSAVKASPDLKGDNTVGESFVLPHDVLVEQNGKTFTLKAGTNVRLVKEAEGDDLPDFMKGGEGEGEVGEVEGGEGEIEGGEGEAGEVAVGSEMDKLSEMDDATAIDRLASAVDQLDVGMSQFFDAEAAESEHADDVATASDAMKEFTNAMKEFLGEEGAEVEHGGEEMGEEEGEIENDEGIDGQEDEFNKLVGESKKKRRIVKEGWQSDINGQPDDEGIKGTPSIDKAGFETWLITADPQEVSQIVQQNPEHGNIEAVKKIHNILTYGPEHRNAKNELKALAKYWRLDPNKIASMLLSDVEKFEDAPEHFRSYKQQITDFVKNGGLNKMLVGESKKK